MNRYIFLLILFAIKFEYYKQFKYILNKTCHYYIIILKISKILILYFIYRSSKKITNIILKQYIMFCRSIF